MTTRVQRDMIAANNGLSVGAVTNIGPDHCCKAFPKDQSSRILLSLQAHLKYPTAMAVVAMKKV